MTRVKEYMKPKFLSAIHNLIATFAVVVVVVSVAGHAVGQIDDLPPKLDMTAKLVEEPEKVPGEKGKYKLVQKNTRGQVLSVTEYEPVEAKPNVVRKVKDSYVSLMSNGGTSVVVTAVTYEDDPKNAGAVRDAGETILSYNEGVLREKSIYATENGTIDHSLRTITRYTPGQTPKAVTQREKLVDPTTGKWSKLSPFEGTTWRLEVDGKQQAGEYSFLEAPGISEIRQDSKVWLLMFKSQTEIRTVVRPAESNDNLGFARKFIQLRGEAAAGRLEFWLTPDETTMDFKPTKYTLVREDN